MKQSRPTRIFLLVAVLAVGVLGGALSVGAVRIGDDEGCTPGFWKNNTGAWEEYTPGQTVGSVFEIPAFFSELADDTLLDALNYDGGPFPVDMAELLLKQAVAAILNAAHEDIGYPYRRFDPPLAIIPAVNAALASGDRDTMGDLKDILDEANQLGCPLSADEAS
jgi:hypothetical protein